MDTLSTLIILVTTLTLINYRNVEAAAVFAASTLGYSVADEKPVDKDELSTMKQDYEAANKIYQKALAEVQALEKNKVWPRQRCVMAYTYIYDDMANLAMMNSKFEKAKKLYQEMMRGLKKLGRTQDDPAMVEISLKMSMLLSFEGKHGDAQVGYLHCFEQLEIYLTKNGKTANFLALLGMCIDANFHFLIGQRRYAEAETLLLKAVDIARCVFGDCHPRLAVLLSNLGAVASLQNHHEAAQEHLSQAMEVAKKATSDDLPMFYCNLGTTQLNLLRFSDAKKTCSITKSLARKMKDEALEKKAKKMMKKP